MHRFGVAAEIETHVAANVVERDRDQQVVDVVAAEVGVAVGGDDFENSVVQLEDGNVEGAAAEVVDGDDAVLFLVEAVGERCGGGLVHQAQNFEAGDAACVFCRLALRVVEIRGNGDDRLRDRRSEKALRVALELAEDERGNLRRRKGLVSQLDAQNFAGLQVFGQAEGEELQLFLDVFNAAAHQALDRVDGAFRGLDQISARGIADDGLTVFVERDDRRDEIQTIVARDHDRVLPLHEGHERIRGAQVDADDAISCHCNLQLSN